jgi:hypothetical protein
VSDSKIVFVLGPDRSGTSLTASISHELGVPFKGELQADAHNERGHWEEKSFKALPRSLGAPSTVHDRFQEWKRAVVFEKTWTEGLLEYNAVKG